MKHNVRYQPQYKGGANGPWVDEKDIATHLHVGKQNHLEVEALLIDHGEGAEPRWTYERIEVK